MRVLIGLSLVALGGCSGLGPPQDEALAKQVISDRCGACHTVPGVRSAAGKVGPSLAGIAKRQVIGGRFPNSRANLMQWITHAQTLEPGIVMPDIPLTERQTAAVADYLYTLD